MNKSLLGLSLLLSVSFVAEAQQKKIDKQWEEFFAPHNEWVDRLKKSDKLSAKVTLFTIRAGILYGIYALIVSL